MNYTCPVCGYNKLNEPPYDVHNSPSYEICPSCGTEFGFDDFATSIPNLRQKWIENGMEFWNASAKPDDWNPLLQLKNIHPNSRDSNINHKKYIKKELSEIINIIEILQIRGVDSRLIPDEIASMFDNLYIYTKTNLKLDKKSKQTLDEIDGLLLQMSNKSHTDFQTFWNSELFLSTKNWQTIYTKLQTLLSSIENKS